MAGSEAAGAGAAEGAYPAVIQSRCTDDQGEVQPSLAQLYKNWGITGEDARKAPRTSHINAMQPWKVARDGSISDAMFA